MTRTITTLYVLDKGHVTLVDSMGGDQRIVDAARVSYGATSKRVRSDDALIDYLIRHNHTSVLEQVVFTFVVRAPIFVARQVFRHRTARVNEVSGRYSQLPDDYYVPEPTRVGAQGVTNRQGTEGELSSETVTNFVLDADANAQVTFDDYNHHLSKGVSRELARIILPLSTYTEFYWQIDLHNLMRFLRLRLAPDAQWETRQYAEALLQLARPVAPIAIASWEEHHLYGVRFSYTEVLAILRALPHEPGVVEAAAKDLGLKGSHLREFMEKLEGER